MVRSVTEGARVMMSSQLLILGSINYWGLSADYRLVLLRKYLRYFVNHGNRRNNVNKVIYV